MNKKHKTTLILVIAVIIAVITLVLTIIATVIGFDKINHIANIIIQGNHDTDYIISHMYMSDDWIELDFSTESGVPGGWCLYQASTGKISSGSGGINPQKSETILCGNEDQHKLLWFYIDLYNNKKSTKRFYKVYRRIREGDTAAYDTIATELSLYLRFRGR